MNITIIVANDTMTADMVIEPGSAGSENLSYSDCVAALKTRGVISGINEKMLLQIEQKWREKQKHYEWNGIARGTPAQPGKEGGFLIKLQHITDKAELQVVKNAQYYWQVADKIDHIPHVSRSAVIAEKKPDVPSLAGKNVLGEPVFTEQRVETPTRLGESVLFTKDRSQIIAGVPGVVYCIENTIGLVPLNYDGSFDIEIDSSKLEARLICHFPGEGGVMPQEQDLRILLKEKGILHGVHEKGITALYDGFANRRFPSEPIVIAKGQPPQNGENGKIEFLFNIETSLKPKLNEDGSADYKSVNIVNAVNEGEELAMLIAPSKGIPGKNIFGAQVPAKDGIPENLPSGPNTAPALNKSGILVATIKGLARYTGTVVEVTEGYIINGDVDYSTGNVKFEKSVVISGDVKSGFTIDCGGDLQVSGIIEDSTLNIGGNVLCKHGFIGHGKGIIECAGNINLGFIMNETIRSQKSVNIAKEAINSSIYARESISVHGNPLSVAGGLLVARDSITVFNVGNQSGTKTVLEVGVDFTLLEELKKREKQSIDMMQNMRKLKEAAKNFQNILAIKKQLPPKEANLFNQLKSAISKAEEQLRIIEAEIKNVTSKLHELGKAYIKIEHAALPGTHLKIGEHSFIVHEEIIGPKTAHALKNEIQFY